MVLANPTYTHVTFVWQPLAAACLTTVPHKPTYLNVHYTGTTHTHVGHLCGSVLWARVLLPCYVN